jgi:hypothetical protein
MSAEQLMKEFGFSQEDLDANKQGIVTEGQQGRLRQKRFLVIAGYTAGVAAFLLGTIYLYFVQHNELYALGSLVGAFAVGFQGYNSLKGQKAGMSVQRVEGPAKLEKKAESYYAGGDNDTRQTREKYFLTVDRHKFEIKADQHAALTKGAEYIVYYAPEHKAVLSIEERGGEVKAAPKRKK